MLELFLIAKTKDIKFSFFLSNIWWKVNFEIDSITDCLRLVLKVLFCFENDNSMILFCFVFVILIPINIYIFKREMSLCYVFIACFPFFNFNRYVKCNP